MLFQNNFWGKNNDNNNNKRFYSNVAFFTITHESKSTTKYVVSLSLDNINFCESAKRELSR